MITYLLQINCLPCFECKTGIPTEDKLLYMGIFLILVFFSTKLISWLLPSAKKTSISGNKESVEINVLPLESFDYYSNNTKTTLIARLLILALILVFIFKPISEILNLS